MIWNSLPDFPHYRVGANGSILSLYSNRVLKPDATYPLRRMVTLCEGGKKYKRTVHSLVLEAFVGPRPMGKIACHNNGNPGDNRLENLRWDTYQANEADKRKHGTRACTITDADARFIVYLRRCVKLKYREIAATVGCSMNVVSTVVSKRKWVHIWMQTS